MLLPRYVSKNNSHSLKLDLNGLLPLIPDQYPAMVGPESTSHIAVLFPVEPHSGIGLGWFLDVVFRLIKRSPFLHPTLSFIFPRFNRSFFLLYGRSVHIVFSFNVHKRYRSKNASSKVKENSSFHFSKSLTA